MRGFVTRAEWVADPRPDLHGDSRAWAQLLGAAYDAYEQPHVLFGYLHCARCLGVRLGQGKLTPPADAEGRAMYATLRQQHAGTMTPFVDWLVTALAQPVEAAPPGAVRPVPTGTLATLHVAGIARDGRAAAGWILTAAETTLARTGRVVGAGSATDAEWAALRLALGDAAARCHGSPIEVVAHSAGLVQTMCGRRQPGPAQQPAYEGVRALAAGMPGVTYTLVDRMKNLTAERLAATALKEAQGGPHEQSPKPGGTGSAGSPA